MLTYIQEIMDIALSMVIYIYKPESLYSVIKVIIWHNNTAITMFWPHLLKKGFDSPMNKYVKLLWQSRALNSSHSRTTAYFTEEVRIK